MTLALWGTPVAVGLTITWIARTVMPLLEVPEHGGAPPPSQTCSLRMTEPIPGTRMVVFGGGLSLTAVPFTEMPTKLVPFGVEDDVPLPEMLLPCDVIAVADTVHAPDTGNTQTVCVLA